MLETKLFSGKTRKCKLQDIPYVPKLSGNLLSFWKKSGAGKKIRFGEASCQILDEKKELIVMATKVGDLYHLNCCPGSQSAHLVVHEAKEDIWHQRFGHLGKKKFAEAGLKKAGKWIQL